MNQYNFSNFQIVGEAEHQFWQFDGTKSGRIFSYSTIAFKTLTGNDRMVRPTTMKH